MEKTSLRLLNIAVVGHTNTGKTSLIRTMLRSAEFGEIEDAAGTTRHVEQATISAGDFPVLNLHDTPGLEDTHALYAHLKKMGEKSRSVSPVKILEEFVATFSVADTSFACSTDTKQPTVVVFTGSS